MIRRDRSSERLVALFLLGVLLLLPPLLLVFNRPVRVLGIPLLYLYVFAVWTGLIALAAWISNQIEREPEAGPPAGTDARTGATRGEADRA